MRCNKEIWMIKYKNGKTERVFREILFPINGTQEKMICGGKIMVSIYFDTFYETSNVEYKCQDCGTIICPSDFGLPEDFMDLESWIEERIQEYQGGFIIVDKFLFVTYNKSK